MIDINKIYNEDYLDGLKQIDDSCIDLICVDPPYIISRKTGFNCNNGLSKYTCISYEFGEWDKTELNLEELFKEFYRILKTSGTVICFYDKWKMQNVKEAAEKNKFKQPRLCVWNKTNPVPVNSKLNYLTNGSEYFATFVKGGNPTFNSEYDMGIYSYPICHGKERTKHPTQKPVKLIEELIKKHSNENDLVLDCFLGSGTAAIAAINTKRNYIGFELNKEYFDIANERIANNVLE